MSFYAIDPDLARHLLAHRERPDSVEARTAPADAGVSQGPLAALVLAFGALSLLSAFVPWP